MIRPTWYRFQNRAEDDAVDVFLFNEVGFGGITADAFVADLRKITAGKVNLHLNSPGGAIFDGIAIYSALKEHPAHVTVTVDAVAASIASVIAMAGDRIVMARQSVMMIHEGQGVAMGSAEDMTKMAERLELVSNQIAGVYQERVAGSKIATWRNRMKEETWYTAEEAVAVGLADEVGKKAEMTNSFDLSQYKHAPKAIGKQEKAPVEEPIEFDRAAVLRQAAQVSLVEVLTDE